MEKVKWFNNPYGLSEISQATGIIFSFITPKGIQCHPWVKCRDFLHDAVRSTIQKKPCAIYGFNFDSSKKGYEPVDLSQMRMLVSQQEVLKANKLDVKVSVFTKKMKSGLSILNHYEKMAGVALSTMSHHTDGKTHWWYFEGPQFWLTTPALVSMYTFLIRLGDKKIKFNTEAELLKEYKRVSSLDNKGSDNDIGYILTCGQKLATVIGSVKELLLEGEDFDKDYVDEKVTINNFHNKAGIVSLCSGVYFNQKKVLK